MATATSVVQLSGMVAWAFAAVAVLSGLAMANRDLRGRAYWRYHLWIATTAVVAAFVHVSALLPSGVGGFNARSLVVPALTGRPGAVAATIAWYGLVAAWLTGLARRHGPIARSLHHGATVSFVASSAHFLLVGTHAGNIVTIAVIGALTGTVAAAYGTRLARSSSRPLRRARPASGSEVGGDVDTSGSVPGAQ